VAAEGILGGPAVEAGGLRALGFRGGTTGEAEGGSGSLVLTQPVLAAERTDSLSAASYQAERKGSWKTMTITLAAFIITVLASLSVGVLMLKRSSRNDSWLLKIESERRNPPRD